MTERGLVIVLVLPMSWSSKIAGVNILEIITVVIRPITWSPRIVFILIFVICYYYYFLLFFVQLLRDARVSYFDIIKCGVQLKIDIIDETIARCKRCI